MPQVWPPGAKPSTSRWGVARGGADGYDGAANARRSRMGSQMTAEPTVDPRQYRDVIGRFATGVTVITWDDGESARGMTANAISSVSLDPMLVLICIDKKVSAHPRLLASNAFAINILAHDQIEVSKVFASHGVEGMADVPYELGQTGSPLIDGSIAWIDCEIGERLEGGDHTIFLGKVVAVSIARPDTDPLLFWAGRYRRMGEQV